MSTEVVVGSIPECDFCGTRAVVDGKTKMGPWANMCTQHFDQYGVGLGTGKGQRLIVATSLCDDGGNKKGDQQ